MSLILALVLIIIALIYGYIKFQYSFWSSRGVPFEPPTFPYGNFKGFGTKQPAATLVQDIYKKLKGKSNFFGIFSFLVPIAVFTDLDFIKQILIKDFNYFVDRVTYFNEKDDPLSAHLFSLRGDKWRSLRNRLSPTFTSGKIKMMFPTVVDVADKLISKMNEMASEDSEVEIKDVMARYTTDVIGNCAFGINCDSLSNPENEFRTTGMNVFQFPHNSGFTQLFLFCFKEVGNFLKIRHFKKEVSDFFTKVVLDTIQYRETNNIKRNDFMELCLQLKNQGRLEDDKTGKLVSVSIDEICAQAFVFFLAGFETSSSTMSFALYELAGNQKVQDKARREINDVLEKYDGSFTYEALGEMKYLEQVINETLRMYPIVPNLSRRVTSDYKVPDTDIILPKGLQCLIPIYAIQNDPEVYPNPEVFNPDRFSKEEVQNRHMSAYLPFGEGPRICIGMRFGIMETKIGLAKLLLNHKFSKCLKSYEKIVFNPKNFATTISPLGGMFLNVQQISE